MTTFCVADYWLLSFPRHLSASALFAPHVDQDHIVTLGFSLGGATVLNLAGARMDRDAHRAYCEQMKDSAQDCIFFAKRGRGPNCITRRMGE